MNGYEACERICEIYNAFSSLPDFDDILCGTKEEKKYLEILKKIFEEN